MADETSAENSTDTIKGISLTPVLTAILKPSAELLGAELRDALKGRIDEFKAARKSANLRAHIGEVNRSLRDSGTSSSEIKATAQLDLFEQWVEGASSVDPEEEELSRIWQMLLLDMARGNWPAKALLEGVRQLSSEDARLLVGMGRPFPGKVSYGANPRLERLQHLGFVAEKRLPTSLVATLLGFITFLISLRYSLGPLRGFILQAGMTFVTPDVLFFGSTLVSFLVSIAVLLLSRDIIRVFGLTEFGKQLTSYAFREPATQNGSVELPHNSGLKRTPDGAA